MRRPRLLPLALALVATLGGAAIAIPSGPVKAVLQSIRFNGTPKPGVTTLNLGSGLAGSLSSDGTVATLSSSGAIASGDVSVSGGVATVVGIQGRLVAGDVPTVNTAYVWDGAEWNPLLVARTTTSGSAVLDGTSTRTIGIANQAIAGSDGMSLAINGANGGAHDADTAGRGGDVACLAGGGGSGTGAINAGDGGNWTITAGPTGASSGDFTGTPGILTLSGGSLLYSVHPTNPTPGGTVSINGGIGYNTAGTVYVQPTEGDTSIGNTGGTGTVTLYGAIVGPSPRIAVAQDVTSVGSSTTLLTYASPTSGLYRVCITASAHTNTDTVAAQVTYTDAVESFATTLAVIPSTSLTHDSNTGTASACVMIRASGASSIVPKLSTTSQTTTKASAVVERLN